MTDVHLLNTLEAEIRSYLNSVSSDIVNDFYSRMYVKNVEYTLRSIRGSILYKLDFFSKDDKRKYEMVKSIIKDICYRVDLKSEFPEYIRKKLDNYSSASYIAIAENIPLDKNSLAYGLYEIYKKHNIHSIPSYIIDEFIQNTHVDHQGFYEYVLENMICMYILPTIEEKINCLIEELRESCHF